MAALTGPGMDDDREAAEEGFGALVQARRLHDVDLMLGRLTQLADLGVRDVPGHLDAVAAVAFAAIIEVQRAGRRMPRRRVRRSAMNRQCPGHGQSRYDVPDRGCHHADLTSASLALGKGPS